MDAQLWLLEAVERETGESAAVADRLSFLREIDQIIAEGHRAGLRYPSRLLVHGLASRLSGDDLGAILGHLTSEPMRNILPNEIGIELEGEFYRRLSAAPPLRPGVLGGVKALAAAGIGLVCLTEGAKPRAIERLSTLGLSEYFCRVVEGHKSCRLFSMLQRLSKDRLLMVGDQLSRDIEPAKACGIFAVHFPGGFTPKWEAAASVVPDKVIGSFEGLVKIVHELA